jgi:hypothetical protein
LVSAKGVFSFQQRLQLEPIRHIVDSCQHLKKLSLNGCYLPDDVVIHVIEKLGKQLTSLGLTTTGVTEDGFLHVKNCAR